MAVLRTIAILLIVAWLVLWLAVKLTFAAIHILLAVGIILLIVSLFGAAKRST